MNGNWVVVTGAGGFIGGHLVTALLRQGHTRVRAVDRKPLDSWQLVHDGVENVVADLSRRDACEGACAAAGEIYQLASNMGGIGFVESHKADCMSSVLINTQMLLAARAAGARRFFFPSSARVYDAAGQDDPDVTTPHGEDGDRWEKLFSERMCRSFRGDFGIETRIARYHNVYGPLGAWRAGREKAPAAICRKLVEAKISGDPRIEIWGSGEQTRSFTYIDDCIEGTRRIMDGAHAEPIQFGSSERVSIDRLVSVLEEIAGLQIERRYDPEAPIGANARNSDNTRIRELFGWEPSTSLRDGLEKTYKWVHDEYMKRYGGRLGPREPAPRGAHVRARDAG